MKHGVTTYIWGAEFTPAQFSILPRLRVWGLQGIELPVFRPAEMPLSAIRRALEGAGLECTAALALMPGQSLIDEDPAVRARTLQHVKDAIGAAAELGARVLAGPVYSPVGYLPGRRRTDAEWHRQVEALQALESTLAAHQVVLAVEPLNRFETFFLNTVADGIRLCDDAGAPHVGLLFDTFHANIEEKQVGDALRAGARHVRHIHISENDRGTPGSGHVDWRGVRQAVTDIGYDGWLTIEGFGFSLGDLSAAASIWRDIEETPEAIARDGAAFLRAGAWV